MKNGQFHQLSIISCNHHVLTANCQPRKLYSGITCYLCRRLLSLKMWRHNRTRSSLIKVRIGWGACHMLYVAVFHFRFKHNPNRWHWYPKHMQTKTWYFVSEVQHTSLSCCCFNNISQSSLYTCGQTQPRCLQYVYGHLDSWSKSTIVGSQLTHFNFTSMVTWSS